MHLTVDVRALRKQVFKRVRTEAVHARIAAQLRGEPADQLLRDLEAARHKREKDKETQRTGTLERSS